MTEEQVIIWKTGTLFIVAIAVLTLDAGPLCASGFVCPQWVAEGSPTHSSTPVRIESALQFVPKNTDPREFKKLQQQIKDNRRSDKITSGPQSHILEGVSWEEAKKLQDANISATGDQVILVGAASKGIIQRGFQHNALVYKTPYAKNPFDTITDEELEEYKKVVERKQRGESFDEEQSESEPLSSSLHNSRPTNEESASAAKSPLLSPTSAASETEEESRDEPRVLRIETKQVPRPSQAEVVLSDAEGELPDPGVERTMSLRYPSKAPDSPADSDQFKRTWSLPPDQLKKKGENTMNGDDLDAPHSTFSQSSKEGSPTKDVSTEESPKKDKKKKKGLRTPSFLKKKKEKKKLAEA